MTPKPQMQMQSRPALVVDLKALDAALHSIIKDVITRTLRKPGTHGKKCAKVTDLPDLPAQDDERASIVRGMLEPLVKHAIVSSMMNGLNRVNIDFGDKPEVACLRGKKLRVKEKLGAGAFGTVFAIDAKRAVKVANLVDNFGGGVSDIRKRYDNEVAMGRKASNLHVGPKVIDAFVCSSQHNAHYGIIVMERIRGKELYRWLETASPAQAKAMHDKVDAMIVRMHTHGLYHNDLHASNIMVAAGNRPVFIDFGLAGNTSKPTDMFRRHGDRHRDFDVLDRIANGAHGAPVPWNDDLALAKMVRHVAHQAIAQGVVHVDGIALAGTSR
jgi:serine/threonine protein kinase